MGEYFLNLAWRYYESNGIIEEGIYYRGVGQGFRITTCGRN